MSWKSIRQEIRDRNYFVLFIAIFAFVISFHPRLIPYALGATGLSWLFTKNLLSRLKKLFPNSYFLIILVFYILHVVALLYTYNLKHGLFNLQVRLALLVIPIVVFSSTKEIIRNKALFISSFIIGVSLSAFICYALAFYNAFQNAVNNELLNFDIYKIYSDLPFLKLLLTGHSFLNYGYFSFFIHPNYFAMYITLASLLLYKKIDLQNKKGLNFLYSLLLVFLLITIILLQSRSGIIAYTVLVLYEFFYLIKREKRRWFTIALISLIGMGLLISIYNSERFKQIFIKDTISVNETKVVRLKLWHQALPIIKENFWLGVGTGDIKDTYLEKYPEQVKVGNETKYLNYHNEYLETFARIGVFGFLLLIFIIFKPFFNKWNYKNNRELLAFSIIIAVNFMFESMLVRLNGVVFFALFYSLLNITEKTISSEKSES